MQRAYLGSHWGPWRHLPRDRAKNRRGSRRRHGSTSIQTCTPGRPRGRRDRSARRGRRARPPVTAPLRRGVAPLVTEPGSTPMAEVARLGRWRAPTRSPTSFEVSPRPARTPCAPSLPSSRRGSCARPSTRRSTTRRASRASTSPTPRTPSTSSTPCRRQPRIAWPSTSGARGGRRGGHVRQGGVRARVIRRVSSRVVASASTSRGA